MILQGIAVYNVLETKMSSGFDLNIETETKWLQFRRRYFQSFFVRKLFCFHSNFPEIFPDLAPFEATSHDLNQLWLLFVKLKFVTLIV